MYGSEVDDQTDENESELRESEVESETVTGVTEGIEVTETPSDGVSVRNDYDRCRGSEVTFQR